MSSLSISLLVFGLVFGVGYLATILRSRLPEHHLSAETKDTVKITMGLVGTMTALILGLLVASAKGTYDTQKGDVIEMSAKFIVLDRMFAHYGPEAADCRQQLRRAVEHMESLLWPDSKTTAVQIDPSAASADSLYDLIEALQPKDESQRLLKTQAVNSAIDIARLRWLFFEQASSAISVPLLAVVICWLSVLSFSFGLFAPPNATAKASLFICALSVSGAIFLILELDEPFRGFIHVSKEPVEKVLAHLGK